VGVRGGLHPQVRQAISGNSRQLDPICQEFAMCIAAPQDHVCRVPDSTTSQTSLITSRRLIPVYANTSDTTEDMGRFAALIKPTLGYANDPTNYQVAQIDSSGGWPSNLDSASAYITSNGVDDLRLDKNFSALTQPTPSLFIIGTPVGTLTAADPLFTAVPVQLTGNGEVNSLELTRTVVGGLTYFDMPVGQFYVTFDVQMSSSGTTLPTLNVNVGGGVAWLVVAITRDPVFNTGAWSASYSGIATVSNKPGVERIQCSVTTVTGGVITYAKLTVSPTFVPEVGVSVNAGLVTNIRPVACSVYYRTDLASIDNAGSLAIYQVDSSASKNFFANSTNENNPANWEYAANVKDSYQGRLEHGAYSFWKSMNDADYEMRNVETHCTHEFGGIIVSGQYKPSLSGSGAPRVRIGTMDVTWVYEFNNRSTLFEKKNGVGSRMHVDKVREFYRAYDIPHCMSNDSHKGVINDISKAVNGVGNLIGPLSNLFSWLFV